MLFLFLLLSTFNKALAKLPLIATECEHLLNSRPWLDRPLFVYIRPHGNFPLTLLHLDKVISLRFVQEPNLAISSLCSDVWRIRLPELRRPSPKVASLHPSSPASLLYIPHSHQSPSSLCVWMAPPHCQPVRDGCFPCRPDQDRRLAPGGPRMWSFWHFP